MLKDKTCATGSGQEDKLIQIEKTELVRRMKEIYNSLNTQLRQGLKKIEK